MAASILLRTTNTRPRDTAPILAGRSYAVRGK
jgi:hypothetical protein